MSSAVPLSAPCMWMRGGTSKGGYFLSQDLPQDVDARNAFLLSIMGSPDERQIDGMGGADPLTSKVAIVKKSSRDGVDVDYLFLQVSVDRVSVSDAQNCGNLLAGVGPFAIERGLIDADDGETHISIFMENTGQVSVARIQTPNRAVSYAGGASINGVPGTAAPIFLEFRGIAGATCGALLPTGNEIDNIAGVDVTLIDNGMPCVVLRAVDVGITGTETREQLDQNMALREKLEIIRLKAGPMMNLGDVSDKTVPKMTMVSAPQNGGLISTRTFIPHRCHASIGVLGAVSAATACLLPNSPAAALAHVPPERVKNVQIEHPLGATQITLELNDFDEVICAGTIRTARKLFDGIVFAHLSKI
jgi:4-oxalomesaconate tautomerase